MTILLFAPFLILTLYFLFRRFRNTRERLILFTGAVLMCGVLLAGYGNILLLPLFVGLPLGVLIFFVYRLQVHFFKRDRNGRTLVFISLTQLLISVGIIAVLLFEFQKGVGNDSIDGPAGMATMMLISMLFIIFSVAFLANLYTAKKVSGMQSFKKEFYK